MKLALLGYGKMGKAIEQYCQQHTSHEIVLVIDRKREANLTTEQLQQADVAIDFSLPELATKHIRACFKANVPIVCGTTGWLGDFETIQQECMQGKHTFFYASNFSIGVNLFWQIVSFAGSVMNDYEFDLSIHETHHTEKQDAPSGTAISTANELLKVMNQYKKWRLGMPEQSSEIPIFAHREKDVPGTHLVTFEDDIEQITIEHVAKSRLGFVKGAIKAAEFIQHKTGYFTMQNLLANSN